MSVVASPRPRRTFGAVPTGARPWTTVAIAAATVDRPDGLQALLDGIARLTFERVAEPAISVVIVDNSATGSAQGIVLDQAARLRWPLIYRHEPRRGLVHARNAQLAAAPDNADWIAMIDDDEIPDPAWLDALLATAAATSVPLVAGPVVPVFTAPPPAWAVSGRFFEMGPFADRQPIDTLYTGNALVSLRTVRAAGWRFDPAFNESGGEDEHFFRRAFAAGLTAVTAADARVFETIPPAKTTPRWLLRRHFRMGTTLATIDRLNDASTLALLRRSAKGLARLALGIARLATVPRHGRLALMRGLADVARGAGAIAGVFGMRYGEYRTGR